MTRKYKTPPQSSSLVHVPPGPRWFVKQYLELMIENVAKKETAEDGESREKGGVN